MSTTAIAPTAPAETGEPQKRGALAIMAERVAVDPAKLLSTLKETVFKGASDSELIALVVTANEYELNPFLSEIYAFPKRGGGIVPIVGIDGWLKIMNRQPNFDGMSVEIAEDGSVATCTIHLKNRAHPVVVTEYLEECRRSTEPWKTMPRRMLRHKALIQCIRVAFGIGGIHDEDEADDVVRNREPKRIEVRGGEPINPFAKPEPETAPEVAEPEPEVIENKPPPAQPPAGDLQVAYISDVVAKSGTTNKRPWKRFSITLAYDEREVKAVTFSTRLGQIALDNTDRFVLIRTKGEESGEAVVDDIRLCDQESHEPLPVAGEEGEQ